MANSKKKKKDNKKTFHCPFCHYSERSVRAKKFNVCPMCGKDLVEPLLYSSRIH